MQLEGLIALSPDQDDLLWRAAEIMGTSFMEEMWFVTWLSALDGVGAGDGRKVEILKTLFHAELMEHSRYQGAYMLEDLTAVAGGFLASDLADVTHSELEAASEARLKEILTTQELDLLQEQSDKMAGISQFEWTRELEKGRDHIYFYAWAVDPDARGTGSFRRLVTPFFEHADAHGLNCYLECYSDRLQSLYEHVGFEIHATLRDPDFEIYERQMVRHPR